MAECNHRLFLFKIPENVALAFKREIAPIEVDLSTRYIYQDNLIEFKKILNFIREKNYWLMPTVSTILAGRNYVERTSRCTLCGEKIDQKLIKKFLLE